MRHQLCFVFEINFASHLNST